MEPGERHDAPPTTEEEEEAHGTKRLLTFCDGVFAIAVTLLALDIRLPAIPAGAAHPYLVYRQDLDTLIGESLIYLLTFAITASYWMEHRRLMTRIVRQDDRFTRLTFLFLAFVVFFPISLNVLVASHHYIEGVILYTGVLAGCGFSAFALWGYASWGRRLIAESVDRGEIVERSINLLFNPVFFCLSLLLLLSPRIAHDPLTMLYSWLLLAIARPLRARLVRRAKLRARQTA